MTVKTRTGAGVEGTLITNYFKMIVNHFFKILPLRENGDASLPTYMQSFLNELLGYKELIEKTDYDPQYLSLIAILQFLIDTPDCSVTVLRREVFRAISICNKLEARYNSMQREVVDDGRLG